MMYLILSAFVTGIQAGVGFTGMTHVHAGFELCNKSRLIPSFTREKAKRELCQGVQTSWPRTLSNPFRQKCHLIYVEVVGKLVHLSLAMITVSISCMQEAGNLRMAKILSPLPIYARAAEEA